MIQAQFPADVAFALASNADYYGSLRAVIFSIQSQFLQQYKKIVVYDLGGIMANSTMVTMSK